MGKLSAFFENAINESQDEPKFKEEVERAYRNCCRLKIPQRKAADMVGVSRTTMNRTPRTPQDAARPAPPNKLSVVERAAILDVLNSPECVDLTDAGPMPSYSMTACIWVLYQRFTGGSSMKNRLNTRNVAAENLVRSILKRKPPPVRSFLWDITKTADPVRTALRRLASLSLMDRYLFCSISVALYATGKSGHGSEMMESSAAPWNSWSFHRTRNSSIERPSRLFLSRIGEATRSTRQRWLWLAPIHQSLFGL